MSDNDGRGRFFLKRLSSGKFRVVDRDPPPHQQEIAVVAQEGTKYLESIGLAEGDDISVNRIIELMEDDWLHVSVQEAPRSYINQPAPRPRGKTTDARDAHLRGLPINHDRWPSFGRLKRRQLGFSRNRQELYYFIAVGERKFMTFHILKSGLEVLDRNGIRVGDTIPEDVAQELQAGHTYDDAPIVGFAMNVDALYGPNAEYIPAPWSPLSGALGWEWE